MKARWKDLLETFFAGMVVGYVTFAGITLIFMLIGSFFDEVVFEPRLFLSPLGVGVLVGIMWVLEDLNWTKRKESR